MTNPPVPPPETTLFDYYLATQPQPLQAGDDSLQVNGTLNLHIAPPKGGGVFVNQLTIAVPTGPGGLFQQAPALSLSTAKWEPGVARTVKGSEIGLVSDQDYFQFLLACQDPSDYGITYSLVIALAGAVTPTEGDYVIQVLEHSGTTSDPSTFTDRKTQLTVSVVAPQFYLSNLMAFVSDPQQISGEVAKPLVPVTEFGCGADINLKWESSDGAWFQVYKKGETVPFYSGDTPTCTLKGGVSTDTTFFLVASMTGDPTGDEPSFTPVYLFDAITITITNPVLTPTSVASSGDINVGGNLTVGAGGAANVPGVSTLGIVNAGTLDVNNGATLPSRAIVKSNDDWQTAFVVQNDSSNKAFQFLVGGNGNNQAWAGIGGFAIYDSVGGFRFNINSNGNVGIGTTSPATKLNVDPQGPGGILIGNPNTSSDGYTSLQLLISAESGGYSSLQSVQSAGSTFGNLILNPSGGNVGIGTTTPGAPLHVQGNVNITEGQLIVTGGASTGFNVGFYIDRDDYYNVNNTDWQANVSILAGYIVAQAVFAQGYASNSDERIKNIQGRSDGAEDLRTLLGIEVTDYRYKDVISQGSFPHKKLIAQQVEQVFPQAVSKRTAVVPDIYRPASFTDGWVELATDLKKGERVRLIADKAEGVYEVVEVAAEKFRTDFKPEGDKVFVFGREVDDFRTLDYDAIAMLNLSATQELHNRIEQQATDLAARDRRISSLEERLAQLEVVVRRNVERLDGAAEHRVAA